MEIWKLICSFAIGVDRLLLAKEMADAEWKEGLK